MELIRIAVGKDISDRLRASSSATQNSVKGLSRRSVYDMQLLPVSSEASRVEHWGWLCRWKGNNKMKQKRLQRKWSKQDG